MTNYADSLSNWLQPIPVNQVQVPQVAIPSLELPSLSGTGVYANRMDRAAMGGSPFIPNTSEPVAPPAANNGSIWDSFLSKDGQQGWGNMAFGALGGIANLYMGLQQLGVAKDTLAQNKAMFEKNYAAQKATTNANLEDRQRARIASNPGAYQSVGAYMAQNGIK